METFELIASRHYVRAAVAGRLEAFDRVANSDNYWYVELDSVRAEPGEYFDS